MKNINWLSGFENVGFYPTFHRKISREEYIQRYLPDHSIMETDKLLPPDFFALMSISLINGVDNIKKEWVEEYQEMVLFFGKDTLEITEYFNKLPDFSAVEITVTNNNFVSFNVNEMAIEYLSIIDNPLSCPAILPLHTYTTSYDAYTNSFEHIHPVIRSNVNHEIKRFLYCHNNNFTYPVIDEKMETKIETKTKKKRWFFF